MQVLRDRQYGVALVAAPFSWLLLMALRTDVPDGSWPLRDPVPYLMVVVLYPLLEEMVFRGLLQTSLYARRWGATRLAGISCANWLAATAFAASHMFWHSPAQALAVLLPGLVFGYFRDRYGRIMPSVLLHMFYNSGFAWLFAAPLR